MELVDLSRSYGNFYAPAFTVRLARADGSGPRAKSVGQYLNSLVRAPGKEPTLRVRQPVFTPWHDKPRESYWARLAVPMAGNGRGTVMIPEVGDEVLVAFEREDLRFPYVLGATWNGKDKPPVANDDGKNDKRIVKSRKEHYLLIPSWAMDDDERDFGRALLRIAARFSSEVAERLDRGGEKMRLGFLDWLAVHGKAARPARVPVVFKLADSVRKAVLATAATRLQVEAAGVSVILETEKDLNLLPSKLSVLVGVDTDGDAFYLPPPGLSSLAPLEPLPTQWQLKSFASAGATKLQLDPEQGLVPEMLVELRGQQYRIAKVDKDIVTLDPPLTQDQTERSIVTLVTAFAPFDGPAVDIERAVGHQ